MTCLPLQEERPIWLCRCCYYYSDEADDSISLNEFIVAEGYQYPSQGRDKQTDTRTLDRYPHVQRLNIHLFCLSPPTPLALH